MDRTKLTQELSRLANLKQSLFEGEVEDKYIRMYHESLSELEKASGYNLSRYRIPDSEIKPQVIGWSQHRRSRTQYENVPEHSDKRVCEWTYFQVQIDTVLDWFTFEVQRPEQRPIGFRPPQ